MDETAPPENTPRESPPRRGAIDSPASEEQTAIECDFIEHFLPRSGFRKLLDLACGSGRHALELSRRGYTVTGVDTDVRALAVGRARAAAEGLETHFLELDIRNIDVLGSTYDGILLFWQSFGFFVGEPQVQLIRQIRRLLAPRGRLLVDLYNRLHFTPGSLVQVPGLDGPRYSSDELTPAITLAEDLVYQDRERPTFADPTLLAPGEVGGLLTNYGLAIIAACSEYSPLVVATKEHPRMQLVFEKT